MAARNNLRHSPLTRERIKIGMLVSRLSDHAAGLVEMTSSQVRAAEILLRKVLPDLRQVELTGPAGGALQIDDARQRNLDLIEAIAGRTAGGAEPEPAASGVVEAEPGGTADVPVGVAELVGEG